MENIKQYYLMLSEGCNLSCKYCYEFNKPKVSMSDEVLDKCIHFINNNQQIDSVVLFGGEPTLNPKAVVKCLKEITENVNIIFITNGLYTNDDILEAVRNRKNIILQVSLDGNVSTMKLRVDTYKQFEQIVDNARKYSEAVGKENMFHHITITRDNINLLYENVVYLLNLGLAGNINTTVNNNEDYTDDDLILYENQLQLIKDYLLTLDYETNIRPISEKSNYEKGEPVCPAGHYSVIINNEGDIYPCSRFYTNFNKEDYKMGDIYNGINKQFIHPSFKNTKCGTCEVKECLRCLAANLEKNNDMTNVNDNYCKMQFANARIKKQYREEREILNLKNRMDLKNKIMNVQVIITKECNFKCSYCFSDNNGKTIELSTLDSLFHLLSENWDSKMNINFFGGEPMLKYNSIIKPFIDKLRSHGYPGNFSIVTNGSLFNKEILDSMMNDNMSIMISLDGDFDTFSKNRNGNINTFNNIINAVKYLVENNYENFETRLTYTRDNIKSLFKNVKYIYDLGVNKVQLYHEYDIDLQPTDIDDLIVEFINIFRLYRKESPLRIHFIDRILHFILNKDKYTRSPNAKCGLIDEDQMSFSVDYNGNIYTCHHFNSSDHRFDKFKLGDVKNGILKDLYEKVKIDNLIKDDYDNYLKREEKCSKCAMYNLCSSICIMQNLEINDSIFINDEKACLINNVMYYVIESELKSLS